MDKLIKKAQAKSLSGKEVVCLARGKANIISYPALKNVKKLDEIMKNGACIILYLTSPNYGHWTCVFYRNNEKGKKIIEFFDSYGISPDLEKEWLKDDVRKGLGMEPNCLSKLLAESGYAVEYNHYKFQKGGINNSTCGRWCALRLNLRHLTLEEFHKLFDIKKPIQVNGDALTTILTMFDC